ncbi:MAG: hypothetical protein WC998_02935 [Candidatus Paceibacterota bacterium]|jgi:hypothetical protein
MFEIPEINISGRVASKKLGKTKQKRTSQKKTTESTADIIDNKNSGSVFDNLSIRQVQLAFKISRQTVQNWITSGCPRNQDNTMSIFFVHQWLVDRDKKKEVEKAISLKDKKIEKDIELTEVKIQKVREELIERSVMEDTLASRSKTESEYWENAIERNAVYMANQPIETLKVMLRSFLCEGTSNLVSE